jgi:hypothetical protein
VVVHKDCGLDQARFWRPSETLPACGNDQPSVPSIPRPAGHRVSPRLYLRQASIGNSAASLEAIAMCATSLGR